MIQVIGLVACLISQGHKGTYMTYLKVYGENKTHYLVSSDGMLLIESDRRPAMAKINKKHCRKVVKYGNR